MEGCVSIMSLLQGFSGERPTHLAGRDMLTPNPTHLCSGLLNCFQNGRGEVGWGCEGGSDCSAQPWQAASLSTLCTQELDKDVGWG